MRFAAPHKAVWEKIEDIEDHSCLRTANLIAWNGMEIGGGGGVPAGEVGGIGELATVVDGVLGFSGRGWKVAAGSFKISTNSSAQYLATPRSSFSSVH